MTFRSDFIYHHRGSSGSVVRPKTIPKKQTRWPGHATVNQFAACKWLESRGWTRCQRRRPPSVPHPVSEMGPRQVRLLSPLLGSPTSTTCDDTRPLITTHNNHDNPLPLPATRTRAGSMPSRPIPLSKSGSMIQSSN